MIVLNSNRIGLLTSEMLDSEVLGADPFAPMPTRPVVLAIDKAEAAPPTLPETQPVSSEPQIDNCVINGWVEGLAQNESLQPRNVYVLRLNVDAPRVSARLQVGGISTLV